MAGLFPAIFFGAPKGSPGRARRRWGCGGWQEGQGRGQTLPQSSHKPSNQFMASALGSTGAVARKRL